MIVKRPELSYTAFMRRWYDGDRSFPKMLDIICSYVAWTDAGQCMIRDATSHIVPLHHNLLQKVLFGSMMVLAAMRVPIRVIGLKYRKGGFTTGIQTLNYYICAHVRNQVASMMAHQADSTVEIFDIALLVSEKYTLIPARVGATIIKFPGMRSRYSCRTAGGKGAGAGGSPTSLHISEYALCDNATKQLLYTAMEAVPGNEYTIIVLESTARGKDQFWNRFDAARKDPMHGYVSVFMPWFMDNRYVMPLAPGEEFNATKYELWLVKMAKDQYGLEVSHGALNWRRWKIKDLGDVALFRQEYPATPEEAVQGRKSLILPNMRSTIIDALPFRIDQLEDETKVGGADFGHNDPTVIGTGYYVDQVLYVTQIYHAVGALARDWAAGVKDGHTYYCDPSALQDRCQLDDELPGDTDAVLLPAPRMTDTGAISVHVDPEWAALRQGILDGKVKILASAVTLGDTLTISGPDQVILEADSLEWNPITGKPNEVRNPGVWWHFDCCCMLRYMYVGCLLCHFETDGVVIMSRKN